ncbi:MAG: HD domain-containing protein [Ruminococcaceae bacterium]|nr:HD domain-containing protein [Oscillospiraceae bacterium]
MTLEDYKKIIRENLDDYRYYHSLCVADEAKRLAIKYGENQEKAFLAGLLHDITKNYSKEEHLKVFERFDIILTEQERNSEKLWHAITGSAYVKHILFIDDNDIISAIRYHTTARKNMSLLEKIVYLADFTSADRKYPDVDIMRQLVDISLEKAMEYSLKYTIKSLKTKGFVPHSDTMSAYYEITQKLKSEEI